MQSDVLNLYFLVSLAAEYPETLMLGLEIRVKVIGRICVKSDIVVLRDGYY